MSKTIPAKVRTCNCTDYVLPNGIIRSLLEMYFPTFRRVNKIPCNHWESILVRTEWELKK